MKPFLMTLLCFSLLACANHSEKLAPNSLWHFNAKGNNAQMDAQVQPLIIGYQELLKGVTNKDTGFVSQTSTMLIHLSDSLAALPLTTDTALKNSWVNGLGNFSAELKGVIESNASQDTKELTLSVNMTAVQLLQLLSEIGYKQRVIYIFNAPSEYIEDGVYWFGFQKNAINPFNVDQKKETQAMGVLQEMK